MKKENKILEKALEYLNRKISVVPVKKDKIPLIKWEEFQTRYPTKEEVISWWTKWPEANVAIVTGKISGLTIIDIEAGGDINKFPKTATIKSGGGGWHLYYAYHPIKSATRVMSLTDIKSDGGLCTAPPSIHASGQEYKILTKMNCVPFPAELFGEVQLRNGKDISKLLNESIPEGDRNNTATSICGKLLLRFKEQEWETQAWPLFKAWNTTHNQPPLSEKELGVIFRSISQAEQRRKASGSEVGEPVLLEQGDKFVISVPIIDGFAIFEFEDIDYIARSIDTVVRCSVEMPGTIPRPLVQRINILSGSAKESFARQLRDSFVSSKKVGWPLIFSQACQLLESSLKKQYSEEVYSEEEVKDTSYLIKPFIEEGTSNIFFGNGSSGKTYLILRMAISLATDAQFLGMVPEKKVNTLFVDYENNNDVWKTRITKLLKGIKYDNYETIKQRLFYFSGKMPLHDLKYKIIESVKKRNIGLVIIDSAALACGGEPESAEIANRLFNAINSLKTTVLLIAHETKNTEHKNKTPFGSIFFYNCARNIWNVEKSQEQDEDIIQVGLFHRKSNNDKLSSPKSAKIEFGEGIVKVGIGEIGQWTKELSLRDQIIDILTEEEGKLSLSEITKITGKDGGQVRKRLMELKKKEIIVNPERGFWCLKSQENQTTSFI